MEEFRSEPVSEEKKEEFWEACYYEQVQGVKRILEEVAPQQLPQLLWNHEGRTGLDECLWHNDEECVKIIVEQVVNSKDHLIINKSACFQFIQYVFPYSALVNSVNLTQKILGEYPDRTSELLGAYTRYKHKYKKCTALHVACQEGHTERVMTLLDLLEICTTDGIKQVLLSQNEDGQTALDRAITGKYGTMIVSISLLAVQDTATYTKLKLLSYTRKKSDRNPFAEVDSKSWQFVLNHLLNRIRAAEDEIARFEKLIKQLGNEYEDEREKQAEALLKLEKGKLQKYSSALKYLPLMAAEKNKFGECLYDDDDLTSRLLELLDICYNHNMDCSSALSEMFPSFSFRIKQEISQCNQIEEEQEDEDEDEEDEKCTAGKKKQDKLLPYSKAAPIHPLTLIGEAGNLAIIKHPYMRTHVDACWSHFGRDIFGTNVILYTLFLFFLITFFTSHQVKPYDANVTNISNINSSSGTSQELYRDDNITSKSNPGPSDDETLYFSSHVFWLTEISRYGAIILSLCGLIFECIQFSTKRQHYFNIRNQFENYIDVLLFVCTPVVLLLPLTLSYNKHIHWAGSVLILIAGIRAGWMFTHINILGIGHGFRMLFSVLLKVANFSPILVFYILIFAVVFHNLFQNQEPFSHMGFSIMRMMAMSVGEIDFTDTFFDETNVHTFGIVAFLILVIFLAIMTISMMNLLIGLAVPDVDALSKQGEQEDFKSKVDLILQYSYMMPWISRVGEIQARSLCEIYNWGNWQHPSDRENELEKKDNDWPCDEEEEELAKLHDQRKKNNNAISDKFKEYMMDIEKEYSQYRVSSNQNKEMEEQNEKIEEQKKMIQQLSDIAAKQNDTITKQHEEMKNQNEKTQQLSDFVAKQNEIAANQHEEMMELINKVILKK